MDHVLHKAGHAGIPLDDYSYYSGRKAKARKDVPKESWVDKFNQGELVIDSKSIRLDSKIDCSL